MGRIRGRLFCKRRTRCSRFSRLRRTVRNGSRIKLVSIEIQLGRTKQATVRLDTACETCEEESLAESSWLSMECESTVTSSKLCCGRKRTCKFRSAIQPHPRPEVANVDERPCVESDDFGKRGENAAGAEVDMKEGIDSTSSGDWSFDEKICSSGTELSIFIK